MEALRAVRDRDHELQGSCTGGDDRSLCLSASPAAGQEGGAGFTEKGGKSPLDRGRSSCLESAQSTKKSLGRRGDD